MQWKLGFSGIVLSKVNTVNCAGVNVVSEPRCFRFDAFKFKSLLDIECKDCFLCNN